MSKVSSSGAPRDAFYTMFLNSKTRGESCHFNPRCFASLLLKIVSPPAAASGPLNVPLGGV